MIKAAWRQTRKEVVFDPDSGKLYRFSDHQIEVLAGWPRVRAWRKTQNHPGWRGGWAEIEIPRGDLEERIQSVQDPLREGNQLLFPFAITPEEQQERQRLRAELPWHARIPRAVRNALADFTEGQWSLLAMVAYGGPAALDLIMANPALAWALANSRRFRGQPVTHPWRSVRRLLGVGHKQREILEFLELPATEPVRKLFAKVVTSACTWSCLQTLRRCLKQAELVRILSHLPRLNAGVLALVSYPAGLARVTPKLLEDTALHPQEASQPIALGLLRDLLEMERTAVRRWPVFRGLQVLYACHDQLIERINALREVSQTSPFPAPPFAGNELIVPITTAAQLQEEGQLLKNCAFTYLERIVKFRTDFIYRVLKPQRCTLEVFRTGHIWQLGQLKACANRYPAPETCQIVHQWYRAQGGIDATDFPECWFKSEYEV